MAWRDRVKNAGSKIRNAGSKVSSSLFRRNSPASSAPSTPNDTIAEQLSALRLKQAEAAAREPYQLFNRANVVRGAKKYSAILIILVLISLPVIIFVYLSVSNHTGFFSYQEQSYYGPIFSAIGSYISPLFSLVSNELACVANPVTCAGTQNTNVTQSVYPTFTSFLTTVPTQNPQTAFIISSSSANPVDLFYTVKNTANVDLGTKVGIPVLVNTSCGSTDDPAAAFNCIYTTGITSPTEYDAGLTPLIYSGQTITNQTAIGVSCPPSTSPGNQVQLDSIASLQLNFTIENYTAASIFPIELVENAYAQELSVAGQPLIANAPSVTFVSPGPVQVTLSTSEPQPVETITGNIPINIGVTNSGSGSNYYLNSLSVFVPMSLWPVNPSDRSNPNNPNPSWTCSPSNGGRTTNFVLPNNNYWNCTAQNPNNVVQLVLSQVTTLPGAEHFDTVPLLAHINYDYIQDMDMPYVLRGESSTTC